MREQLGDVLAAARVPAALDALFAPVAACGTAGPALSPRRAVLWDVDGTLVDTEPAYAWVTRELWPACATMDGDALVGRSERANMAAIAAHVGLAAGDVPAMLARRDAALTAALAASPPRPLPGALRWVRHLVRQRVPIGLVTSSQRALLVHKLGPTLAALLHNCPMICDGDTYAAALCCRARD